MWLVCWAVVIWLVQDATEWCAFDKDPCVLQHCTPPLIYLSHLVSFSLGPDRIFKLKGKSGLGLADHKDLKHRFTYYYTHPAQCPRCCSSIRWMWSMGTFTELKRLLQNWSCCAPYKRESHTDLKQGQKMMI